MIFFMALAMTLTAAQAQIRIGGKSINLDKATQAVSKVAKAVTLSDADISNLCHESVEWMDKHNEVAKDNSEYAKRLARLTKGFKEVNGMPLNFKVYLVTDINAFASGDGSVRVFSSLMDIMDDDELMGVIGHEIGHVANTDVKDAMKQAYMTAGLIDAASAVSNSQNWARVSRRASGHRPRWLGRAKVKKPWARARAPASSRARWPSSPLNMGVLQALQLRRLVIFIVLGQHLFTLKARLGQLALHNHPLALAEQVRQDSLIMHGQRRIPEVSDGEGHR